MSVAAGWAGLLEGEELAHLEEVPAREAVLAPLPDALHPRVREALAAQGVEPSENQDVKAFLTHERDAFGRAVRELSITVGQ